MKQVMHHSLEAEAIRQHMEVVRCDLDVSAQSLVESARELGDWRHYVKTYPWVCLGAACAVGYAIVPRRRAATRGASSTSGAGGALLIFAGNLLWRSAVSYATRQAGQYFAAPPAATQPDDQP